MRIQRSPEIAAVLMAVGLAAACSNSDTITGPRGVLTTPTAIPTPAAPTPTPLPAGRRLRGVVTDREHGVNATILILDGPNAGRSANALSWDGEPARFTISDLTPGPATVRASYPGYADLTKTTTIRADADALVRFTLRRP